MKPINVFRAAVHINIFNLAVGTISDDCLQVAHLHESEK